MNSASPRKIVRLLAISGSLRQASINSALLRVAARIAPAGIEIELYRGLGGLPLFNPDLEGAEPPTVLDLRARVQAADGLLIAIPEYAHGVTGAIKNALDWLVGGSEFVDKPVALLNAAPRAHHARAALREIVTVMSGRLIEAASLTIPLAGDIAADDAILDNPEAAGILLDAVVAFARAIAVTPAPAISSP